MAALAEIKLLFVLLFLLTLRFGDASIADAGTQKVSREVPVYGKYEICAEVQKHYSNPFNTSEVSEACYK